MNIDDIQLKLLLNRPVATENISGIMSPKLSRIIDAGYSAYESAISTLLFNKKRIPELKDVSESNFLVAFMCLYNNHDFQELFKMGIRLMIDGEYDISIEAEDNVPFIGLGDLGQINESNFDDFQTLVKHANKFEFIDEKDTYDVANSKAKEMLEKIIKGKANKPQKKPVTNLHSMISGLAWKSGIDINNISEMTIYQFYDGYKRMENIDYYNGMLTGIYTGNIDTKKLDMKNINWAKII